MELKEAGYSAKALKEAGYSDDDILHARYPPFMLKKAGYSTEVIKKSYCFENEDAFFEKLTSISAIDLKDSYTKLRLTISFP